MCGISGFAGSQGTPDALRRMTLAIQKRGPDDEGFYEAPGVGFGFRRLSIIDVAGGHQPLSNEDGTIWVMLNGEIYGYQPLHDELIRLGHRFATKSDTETIVHAYEEWGDACFEKLNGMFAIAIWDSRTSRLVIARDRVGKKPLYWTAVNGTLWFCSEMKGLLAAGVVQREIDLVSLGCYFRTDSVPTPRSIFKGVQKLEPATAMSWRNGQMERTWSFWRPSIEQTLSTPKDAIATLRETIDISVRERMIADVPLGIFLSGGIDSAVIAESAARQSASPLEAYTIGFDDASHDESEIARDVAKTLGLNHHVEILTAHRAFEMMDEAVACLDEPLGDSAILPQMLLAQFARKYVKVAIAGDGGDELLCGYQHVPVHQFAEAHPFIWKRGVDFRKMVRGVGMEDFSFLKLIPAGNGYFSFGFKLQRLSRGLGISNPWSREIGWRGPWTPMDLTSLLLPSVFEQAKIETAERLFEARANELGDQATFWQKWSWGMLRTYLMDQVMVKVDRATMWMALEARAPFLDQRVVEAMFHIPDRLKIGDWKKKRLFKELLRDRIPDEILNRPKHGFGVPTAQWLKGELLEPLRALASPSYLAAQGLFDPKTIERLISEHVHGRIDRRKELMSFYLFQRWYESWVKSSTCH